MKIFTSCILVLLLACNVALAQSVNAPADPEYVHLIERYEIKYGKFAEGLHLSVKPFLRKNVVQLADSVEKNMERLSDIDKFNLQYLRNDSWEWTQKTEDSESRRPFLKSLYRAKSDFYHSRNDDFEIHINPVLNIGMGIERNNPDKPYTNTRGIEIRGMIAKRLGFYSFLTDNQILYPSYVQERIGLYGAVPNEGFYKSFKNGTATDFFSARGYISFQAVKFINMQFGYDRNFIGNGYRSLILSDYSSPYLFFRMNTKIGKFQYTNLFTEIYDQQEQATLPYGQLATRKFFAHHHLSLNVSNKLNIGIFETEVHARSKDQGYFDVAYLNPIIFYRAIEQQRQSSDNALLGMDFRWNLWRKTSFYGQLMLDEFVLDLLKSGTGSWANKYGVQAGAKYIDAFGVNNLDLQGEINIVRPYTYQHLASGTNYVNYNQPLAHPLGANFTEIIGIIRYQPIERLRFSATVMVAKYGADANLADNWGGNPLKPYTTRKQDLGNTIGQGLTQNILTADITASYMLKHNLFIDLRQIVRKLDSIDITQNNTSIYTSFAIRLNIAQRQLTF